MLVRAYGLFWHRDAVNWNPGAGKKIGFRLLGRHGAYKSKLRLADFRDQRGIYILHGNFGVHYVGLAKKLGIGVRLRDHTKDKHKDEWDKFSWFGLRPVSANTKGICPLGEFTEVMGLKTFDAIGDLEALLIQIMGTYGQNKQKFQKADRWDQVSAEETDKFLKLLE